MLHVACRHGETEIAHLLLVNGVNPNFKNDNGNSAPYTAIYRGAQRSTAVSVADINIQNNTRATPLFEAVAANNLNAVRILLELGVDANIPNHQGRLPLTIATCNEISNILR